MFFIKIPILVGYDNFVDIFRGHHKTGLVLGVILYIVGYFSEANVQNRDTFGGC